VAIHGRERGASGDRIDIFKDYAVVRAALGSKSLKKMAWWKFYPKQI
jgi:hypothetical protein